MNNKKVLGRRNFLRASALGILGAGASLKSNPADAGGKIFLPEQNPFPKVTQYRTLGRTGFKVSDIGAGSIQDKGVLGTALGDST